MPNRKLIFLLLIPCLTQTMASFEEKVAQLEKRSCDLDCVGASKTNQRCPCLGTTLVLFGLGLLVALIILGMIKGILGLLFFPRLGMCGMNLLVDLPRPMKKYQEPELAGMQVIYDVAGWPIHPQTGKRSVRPISKNTEFCMNIIFFLTYPFIILVTLCSYCCYKTYDEEGTDNNVYENVNTVVFSECPATLVEDCKGKGTTCDGDCGHDMYKDDDSAEERDTKYVMEQMGRSSDRLRQ